MPEGVMPRLHHPRGKKDLRPLCDNHSRGIPSTSERNNQQCQGNSPRLTLTMVGNEACGCTIKVPPQTDGCAKEVVSVTCSLNDIPRQTFDSSPHHLSFLRVLLQKGGGKLKCNWKENCIWYVAAVSALLLAATAHYIFFSMDP